MTGRPNRHGENTPRHFGKVNSVAAWREMIMVTIPSKKRRFYGMVCEDVEPAEKCSFFTGDLDEAMQTLCGLLNGTGGALALAMPDVGAEGAEIADEIQREIVHAAERFNMPVTCKFERVNVASDGILLLVIVPSRPDLPPYCYDDCPYERVQGETRKMSGAEYKKRGLESFARWLKSKKESGMSDQG